MNGVTIREVGVEEAALVAELFSDFNTVLGVDGLPEEDSYAPEILQVTPAQMAIRLQAMAGIETVLVAETEDGAVALCCLRMIPYIGQDEPYAELTQLYVRGVHMRQGIGAALLGEAERRAQAAGATCLHIITSQSNHEAQAFYRAQGYRSDDIVLDKYFTEETNDVAPSD